MSRRVEVDVAEIERLYFVEGLNTKQVGKKLGCSPNTVSRRIRELDRVPRPPGKQEKYPPVKVGSCGTPGCTDPECEIEPGTCHCGCGERTAIASRHDRRHGRIKDEPCRFIRAHYDRLREEYQRFHAAKMTATMNELYADPRRKARWAYDRHRSTRLYGPLNKLIAEEKGKELGPRPLTDQKHKNAQLVRREAAAALDWYRQDPSLSSSAVVALVLRDVDREALFLNGRKRDSRDRIRRAAEKRTKRHLDAAARLPEYAGTLLAASFG